MSGPIVIVLLPNYTLHIPVVAFRWDNLLAFACTLYHRALAIDVITVKHQHIVRPLSMDFRGLITSVWQKSGKFYRDLRNASTLELTLLVCHSSL